MVHKEKEYFAMYYIVMHRLFIKAASNDSNSLQRRDVWIVKLTGVPIAWKLKLMNEIESSTIGPEL